jgi:hypothetical protein
MTLTAQVTLRGQRPARRHLADVSRYAPVLVLGVFIVVSLMRDGVRATDILRYALYWVVAVVLPGLVVSRSLIRVRATIVEDLAVGAVTGISLEIAAWFFGVTTGLGSIARFWWVPVLVAGAAVPALRRRVLVRIPERVPLPHSAAFAAIVGYILAGLNVNSLVFQAPLPPKGGNTYVDMWWQLSLVQEMMKYQPPQIPQLAGVPFHYHYFANVQIASGARLSGVAPEVVTFRLWFVPVILISVGMAVTLGRALTRSLTAGLVTAGVSYALATVSYIWASALGSMAPSPLTSTSPSQMLANIGLSACAFGAVLLLRDRGRPSRLAVVWVVLVVLGASGDKSTIVPLLLAGTVIATGRAVFTRSWVMARRLAIGAAALLALEAVVLSVAAGTAGGKVTILGPLHFLPVFNGLVPTHELRAMNNGLLLDSITSVRTAVYALLATVVVLSFHTIRLAGVAGLLRRSAREHYVHWWLAGAVLAGYVAMLSVDHVGLSEVFFGIAGGLLGAALTVSVLWEALGRLGAARWAVVVWGLLTGCFVALLVEYVVAQRTAHLGYGALDRILIPLAVVASVVAAGWLFWRRARRRWTRDAAWALVLAAIIGVAVPSTATTVVVTSVRWSKPVVADGPSLVTSGEQKAMLWLRSHSGADDVVATNAYCIGVVTTKNCPARGFWISGLSGRRVVLEGWAYTAEAEKLQGVGGRTYDRQPAPFPERFTLSQAVFNNSDSTALAELRTKFHVRWLVSVHRAGPTPSFPASVAPIRFDNGSVTIFEVR